MTERAIPNAGEIWLHFKGKQYRILAIAEDTRTGERYVVYKALYGTYRDYVRPLSMFMSEVDHKNTPTLRRCGGLKNCPICVPGIPF